MVSLFPIRRRGEVTTHDFLSDPFDHFFPGFLRASQWGRHPGFPRVDVREDKQRNAYVVRADLPGIDPKQVDIDVTGEQLTLSGSYEEQKKEEDRDGTLLYRERRVGSFSRSFTLPGISEDKCEASYRDGVLTITLPKSEARKKKVMIKTT